MFVRADSMLSDLFRAQFEEVQDVRETDSTLLGMSRKNVKTERVSARVRKRKITSTRFESLMGVCTDANFIQSHERMNKFLGHASSFIADNERVSPKNTIGQQS